MSNTNSNWNHNWEIISATQAFPSASQANRTAWKWPWMWSWLWLTVRKWWTWI